MVLHVEGWLRGPGVPELETACSAEVGPISLDLSSLNNADEQGLRLLRTLADNGIELLNVSPLIKMLLEQLDDP